MELQVFLDVEVLIQPEFLRHVPDSALDSQTVPDAVQTQDGHGPARGGEETGGDADQGGLSGPVRTHQAGHLSWKHLQGNVLQGLDRGAARSGKALVQIAGREDRPRGRSGVGRGDHQDASSL